jgi:hypothetical protein
MLRIGMDKTDRTFRKFEYDDERKYGNTGAEKFKVLYEETGVFGEVLSDNVISIKKSTNLKNNFLDIPVYSDVKIKPIEINPVEVKPVEVTTGFEGKKKTKSTKTKKTITGEAIEIKEITLDVAPTLPTSYEYDVLVVDNISYTEDIKYKLNEFGKDGWEVCGFQIVQKLFGGGSQAIIIMKKGLI